MRTGLSCLVTNDLGSLISGFLKTETLHWQTSKLEGLVDALGKKVVKISYCPFVGTHFSSHVCGYDPDKKVFLPGGVGVSYQLNDGDMIFAEFDVEFVGNVVPNFIVPGVEIKQMIVV